MNLPNKLTISRIIMAGILLVLMTIDFHYSKLLALLVFSIASITDALDGQLARRKYGVTAFGALMDPLADKILTAVAFVSFVAIDIPEEANSALLPAWIAVVIIAREFMVTGLRLLAAGQGKIISAGSWGKHKTTWQIVVIILLLIGLTVRNDFLIPMEINVIAPFDLYFHWFALISGMGVAIITLLSGFFYFRENGELFTNDI